MHRFPDIFKLAVLAVSTLIVTACEPGFHKNEMQVMSSKDAITDIPNGEVYGVMSRSMLKKEIAKADLTAFDFLALPDQKFIKEQDWVAAPLDSLKTPMMKRIVHCYKIRAGDEHRYYSIEKVSGPYHLLGSSDEGCFDKGAEAEHEYGVVYVEDDMFHLLKQNKAHFIHWVESLDVMERLRWGIKYVPPANEALSPEIEVTSVKAYREYIRQNRNDFTFMDDSFPLYVGPLTPDQQRATKLMADAEEKRKAFNDKQKEKAKPLQ